MQHCISSFPGHRFGVKEPPEHPLFFLERQNPASAFEEGPQVMLTQHWTSLGSFGQRLSGYEIPAQLNVFWQVPARLSAVQDEPTARLKREEWGVAEMRFRRKRRKRVVERMEDILTVVES